jgi:hypothetical protein
MKRIAVVLPVCLLVAGTASAISMNPLNPRPEPPAQAPLVQNAK